MNNHDSRFNTRFFNSIYEDDYTVTKRSTNKEKIKKEYTYYYLLPDELKKWSVKPYNYLETDTYASYTMAKVPIPDLAFLWTHNLIDQQKFIKILDKVFEYFNQRPKRQISESAYQDLLTKTYITKVKHRISDLKFSPEYNYINEAITEYTPYSDLTDIVFLYEKLYDKIIKNHHLPPISTVSHGDVCFSNLFYDEDTDTLKMIDPRGASNEAELWLEPHYDIAKLSHSICGDYDFFNAGLYTIGHRSVSTHTPHQDSTPSTIFKEYLAAHNLDYTTIRLFEASLFLSMLPLHIDDPHKVVGFILNANNILKEIESNV